MRNWKRVAVEICQDIAYELGQGPGLLVIILVVLSFGAAIMAIITSLPSPDPSMPAKLKENTASIGEVNKKIEETTANLKETIDQLAITIDALGKTMKEIDEKNLAELDSATKKLEENIDRLRPKESPCPSC